MQEICPPDQNCDVIQQNAVLTNSMQPVARRLAPPRFTAVTTGSSAWRGDRWWDCVIRTNEWSLHVDLASTLTGADLTLLEMGYGRVCKCSIVRANTKASVTKGGSTSNPLVSSHFKYQILNIVSEESV